MVATDPLEYRNTASGAQISFRRATGNNKRPMNSSSSPFKRDCLSGKVALVTGGGSGICYEIAKQLLLHGCEGVCISGRRDSFLRNAAATLNAISTRAANDSLKCAYKTCDVRDPSQCKAAVEYVISVFGKVDILVNGAAGNFLAQASQLKPKGFKTVMDIDVQGTFNMCYSAYPYLKKSSSGSIINISATLQYGATWFQAHASAAKSAVDSLTRSLALEWGADKIRVNGIAPGPIANTPGMTKLAPQLDSKDVRDMVQEEIPLGRMGEAFDIGMAAVFLCSSGGSFITGGVVVVDGAQWLYKPPMVPKELVSELSRSIENRSRAQAPNLASKL